MKRLLWIIGFLLTVAPLAAPLKVVSTYEVYAETARMVGAEDVEVTALADGRQDPHYVEARPSYLAALQRADALLLNGLDLEVGFLPPLLDRCGNARIQPGAPGFVDLSRFITPIEVPQGQVDRSRGDIHPFGNPHYHLDPRNMARLAEGLAERLAELDPAHAAAYRKRGAEASARYLALDREIEATLAPLKGASIVSYHSSLDYFTLRYGLKVVGYVEPKPGIRPGPASLQALLKEIREAGVKVILAEPYMDLKVAEKAAGETGARLLVVYTYPGKVPGAGTYEEALRTLAKRLLDAQER